MEPVGEVFRTPFTKFKTISRVLTIGKFDITIKYYAPTGKIYVGLIG